MTRLIDYLKMDKKLRKVDKRSDSSSKDNEKVVKGEKNSAFGGQRESVVASQDLRSRIEREEF